MASDPVVDEFPGGIRYNCPEGVDPEFFQWWMDLAFSDLSKTVPKTAEYGGKNDGSADLRVMGDALGELCGLNGPDDKRVQLELACWFYALGKISRLISDYKAGRIGKADTWFDLTIYAMMARRIQEVGSWP